MVSGGRQGQQAAPLPLRQSSPASSHRGQANVIPSIKQQQPAAACTCKVQLPARVLRMRQPVAQPPQSAAHIALPRQPRLQELRHDL